MRDRSRWEHPPRLAKALLRLCLRGEVREVVAGDLEEEFHSAKLAQLGRRGARAWFWRQSLASIWALGPRFGDGRGGFQDDAARPEGDSLMRTIWDDFAFALRLLNRNRGFGAVAILTLALGIGANTAIFGIVNGVLLKPLPYRSPEKLVFIWDRLEWVGVPRAWVEPAEVADLRSETTLFEGFSILRVNSVDLVGEGDPVQIQFGVTSDNLFSLLGVDPALGRTFRPGDDQPSAEPVVVLGHGFWMRRFAGDPGVVGRRIQLGGNFQTVVGVLPKNFNFLVHSSLGSPLGVDAWGTYQANLAAIPRGNHSAAVLGRIKEGVSFEQAQSELDAISQRHDARYYGKNGFNFDAVPVHADLVRESRRSLLTLLGAVGLVLLIAATNIATLLLAQVQRRERELAVRQALGAGRLRICRQLLVEALVLCSLGGLLGLSVSSFGARLLLRLVPEGLPRQEAVGLDLNVYLFCFGVTLLAAGLCGLAGAMQASRPNLTESLKDGARGLVGTGRGGWARNALVVGEVALTLLLLLGGGLMIRSFRLLQEVDPGFRAENVLTLNTRLGSSRYAEPSTRATFYRELLERFRALPGVVGAGASNALPLSGGADQSPVRAVGGDGGVVKEGELADRVICTPGYFNSLGIALLEGREFLDSDRADGLPVAIIDRKLAQRLFPGESALGRRLSIDDEIKTVVGVVRHARLYRIYEDDRAQIYLPHSQLPTRFLSLALRTSRPDARLAPAVRGALAEMDPNQPLFAIQTMKAIVDDSLQSRRFGMLLLAGFAAVALFLSGLGVYGVVSYMVTMRRSEIALRMALGASRDRVLRSVLRRGAILVGAGVAVGMPLAVLLSRVMEGLIYGVSPTDPITFALGSAFLLAIGLAACYLPAHRATRVDPIEALRAANA